MPGWVGCHLEVVNGGTDCIYACMDYVGEVSKRSPLLSVNTDVTEPSGTFVPPGVVVIASQCIRPCDPKSGMHRGLMIMIDGTCSYQEMSCR